jgi:hypothetical protein
MAWTQDPQNPYIYRTKITTGGRSGKTFTIVQNLNTTEQTITDSQGRIVTVKDATKVTQGPGFEDVGSSYSTLSSTANTQSGNLIREKANETQKAKFANSESWKSTVNTQDPPSQGTNPAAPESQNGQSSANEGFDITADQAVESVERNVKSETGRPLRYPIKNLGQGGDFLEIEMRTYQKSGFQTETDTLTVTRMEDREYTPLRRIYLPIQAGIVDSISVDWGNGEINPITAQFANLAYGTIAESGRSNPLQAAGKFLNNFGAIGEKLLGSANSDIQKLVTNYYTEQAIGQPGLLSRSIGGAINNNLELLFNGPTLRSFTFNFKLTPREPKEAQEIKEIIKVFKKGMSPALSKSGLFLSAPNVFKIKYIYTGKGDITQDHPYLNRIKVAALRDFSVNYTPDGNYMTYNGEGSMTQYDLSMTFGEIDPVYAQDYDEENDKTMGW